MLGTGLLRLRERRLLRSDKLRALGWEPKVDLEEVYGRLIRFLQLNFI